MATRKAAKKTGARKGAKKAAKRGGARKAAKRGGAKKAAKRAITPRKALANTRKLLEQKQQHARETRMQRHGAQPLRNARIVRAEAAQQLERGLDAMFGRTLEPVECARVAAPGEDVEVEHARAPALSPRGRLHHDCRRARTPSRRTRKAAR